MTPAASLVAGAAIELHGYTLWYQRRLGSRSIAGTGWSATIPGPALDSLLDDSLWVQRGVWRIGNPGIEPYLIDGANQRRTARSRGNHIESEVIELEAIWLDTMAEDAKDMEQTYGKQPPGGREQRQREVAHD